MMQNDPGVWVVKSLKKFVDDIIRRKVESKIYAKIVASFYQQLLHSESKSIDMFNMENMSASDTMINQFNKYELEEYIDVSCNRQTYSSTDRL